MHNYWAYILLAFSGHLFYLCKQYLENVKRNQTFKWNVFIASEIMNFISIFVLIYIADNAPSEWLQMSPVVAVMIGGFGSSMLSAIINTRMPKEIIGGSVSDDSDSEKKDSNPKT